MSETVIVALIALAGTVIGSFGGVMASSKLSNYRIQQLEKKVDVHNGFAEKIPVLIEQIKNIHYRVTDIENHK